MTVYVTLNLTTVTLNALTRHPELDSGSKRGDAESRSAWVTPTIMCFEKNEI